MALKKKVQKRALAKLRNGTHLGSIQTAIRESIDSTLLAGDNDPSLEEYEAAAGNLDRLQGEALNAYLELQTGRQERQIQQNKTELDETIGRISEVLNARGFLASLEVENPKSERESLFFRKILECQSKEEDLKINIIDFIDLHSTKAKHQYDRMKEIEQWFLELLGDKMMEKEFNEELAQMRFRHQEQLLSQTNMEDALAHVAMTVQKLRDLGHILVLSSPEGVSVLEDPPSDGDDTVTLLVPTDSGSDVPFHFTIILNDEAMFRDPKVQSLAQQYLKGMIFYGSAAKHKNRQQKRKVIRLMMRQLEAIYNFITRLQNALLTTEKDCSEYKSRVEELQAQKEQAYRDRERCKSQVDDADSALRKVMDEREKLLLANAHLEELTRGAERDRVYNANNPKLKEGARLNASSTHGVAPKTSTFDTEVSDRKRTQMANLDQGVQVGSLSMTVHASHGVSAQKSLIQIADAQIQMNLGGFTSKEGAEFEGTNREITTLDEAVGQQTSELEKLKAGNGVLEKGEQEFRLPKKEAETPRAINQIPMEKVRQTTSKTESAKQDFLNGIEASTQEVKSTMRAIHQNMQTLVASQRNHQSQEMGATMEKDVSGIVMQTQTDEITPADVKEEMQKLKSSFADFFQPILTVLAAQNIIADMPSFPEELRDTSTLNAAAAEIARDVKEHFGILADSIVAAFEKVHAGNGQSLGRISQKNVSEIESRVSVADSSDEMRQVRLKVRQRVFELESEKSRLQDSMKSLAEILQENRANYEGQLLQKEEKILEQGQDNRRLKDLAWSLAESLAKVRDEAISSMPERKSLMDMMQLLQVAEERLGKKPRTSEASLKLSSQLLIQRVSLTDPTRNPLKLGQVPSSLESLKIGQSSQEMSSEIIGHSVSRKVTATDREAPMTWDKERSPIRGLQRPNKSTSTSDRPSRSALEYPRFYIDPVDGGKIHSSRREALQTNKVTQTSETAVETRKIKNFNSHKPGEPLVLAGGSLIVASSAELGEEDLAENEPSVGDAKEIFNDLMDSADLCELEEAMTEDGILLHSKFETRKRGRHSNYVSGNKSGSDYGSDSLEFPENGASDERESLGEGYPGERSGQSEGPNGRGHGSLISRWSEHKDHYTQPKIGAHEEPHDGRGYEEEELLDGSCHRNGPIGGHMSQRTHMEMDPADHHAFATSHFMPLDPNHHLNHMLTSIDLQSHRTLQQVGHQPVADARRSTQQRSHLEGQLTKYGVPRGYCPLNFPRVAFSPTNVQESPESKCGTHLGPQEQKKAAHRASEKVDAILQDMENSAIREVQKLRRSRTSSLLPSDSLQPNSRMAAEVAILFPDSLAYTGKTTTKVTAVESCTDENQREFFNLQQLEKLRRARIHICELKNRLATLENDADQHNQRRSSEEPPTSQMRGPRRSRSRDPSNHQHVDEDVVALGNNRQFTELTKEGLEALRKEARVIKGNIKVLQRGHKEMVCRNVRSPGGRQNLSTAQEKRVTAKVALHQRNEMERGKSARKSKRSRRKKMEGLDQVASKFVQHVPAWQKVLDGVDENAEGVPGPREVEQRPGEMEDSCSARPGTLGLESRDPRVVLFEKRDQHLFLDIEATGFGLNSPHGQSGSRSSEKKKSKKSDMMHLRRKEPSIAELVDGSITRKLKYLRQQRLAQAPQYTEKKLANPTVRTHRGEEPFEGPVDLAPHNFPGLGVIGRPLPEKVPNDAHWQWHPEQSVPTEEGLVVES